MKHVRFMREANSPSPLIAGLATGFSLALLFWLHRFLTFTFLADLALPKDTPPRSVAEFFLVGMMSDWWVASVGFLLIAVLTGSYIVFCSGRSRLMRLLPTAFVGCWGLLLGIHQAYVEFFHHQIIPFHLSYLLDLSFLSANTSSGFNSRTLITYGTTLICGALTWRAMAQENAWIKNTRWQVLVASIVVLSGLVIHALNIRYRVQWFVPEQLQMNLVEKFFATLSKARPAAPLTMADLRFLAFTPQSEDTNPMDREVLEQIVLQGRQSSLPPIEEAIKSAVSERLSAGKPVLALTILMESFRPVDIGIYGGHSRSITPNFDALAREGILFQNAYATGGVTRTGQEAVWCGYLGGQETSTMRGREDVRIKCLPALLKAKYGQKADTAWLHGGDGGFDGQRNYWQRQGVNKVTSRDDFDAEAPRTGWGVGDRTVFTHAARHLAAAEAPLMFSMLLSVSNHIPWDLPGDAPQDPPFSTVATSISGQHPSYLTTAYSDFALGEFIARLKKEDLWNRSVIVVASDHGTLNEAYNQSTSGRADSPERQAAENLSHIALLVTGGLAETALTHESNQKLKERHIKEYVSQAGIAAFWANIFGLAGDFMTPSVFAPQSYPVFSDLGHALYLPRSRSILLKDSISNSDGSDIWSEDERRSILYYRAFTHLINTWGLQPQN